MEKEKRGRMDAPGGEEGPFLTLLRSKAGVGDAVARAGDLLLLIGVGCPFFRLSSVAGGDLQRVVSLFEGGWMASIAWFAWVASFLLRIRLGARVRTKPDWMAKFSRITGVYVATFLLTLLAVICMFASSVWLGSEGAQPWVAELDVGACFFLLGATVALVGVSAFYDRLRQFVQGKGKGGDLEQKGGTAPPPPDVAPSKGRQKP